MASLNPSTLLHPGYAVSSFKIENARLAWQEDGRPFAIDYDDVYFSRGDEVAESQHVFINANKLFERWTQLADSQRPFVVGELGLGCALNLLNTWTLWRRFKQIFPESQLRLHYVSVEKHPLRYQDLERVFQLWPQFAELSQQFLKLYPDHSLACHRLKLNNDLIVDLHYGEALEILRGLNAANHKEREQAIESGIERRSTKDYRNSKEDQGISLQVDCWYADGFNPKTNDAMWQSQLFTELTRCSRAQATLSTYSVAGDVRRALQDCGFAIEKRPGFGNKRHMLFASYGTEPAQSETPPADTISTQKGRFKRKEIAIIGAGLAGCSLAYSLANRGWQVNILEANSDLTSAASTCGQLNLRCHFAAEDRPLTRFYLQAFLFARQQFEQLTSKKRFWHPSGSIQLNSSIAPGKDLTTYKTKLLKLYETAILEEVTADRVRELAGVVVNESGLFFALGGWVEPVELLEAYTTHPNIDIQFNNPVNDIHRENELWLCRGVDDKLLATSPNLAVCTAAPLSHWTQFSQLPIQAIRGQNSFVRHESLAQDLRMTICGERTLFPAGIEISQSKPDESIITQTVSASYHRGVTDLASEIVDDKENIDSANSFLTDVDLNFSHRVDSAVALRYNSIDHAPLVGRIPIWKTSEESAAESTAKTAGKASGNLSSPIQHYPNLYISTAHASSGLASSALAGEYLASLMNAEPLPLCPAIAAQIAPLRYYLRTLRKQSRPV